MRGNDLKTEFSKFGEVVSARVNLDQTTKPQAEMDGVEVWGRMIKVDFAKENPNRVPRSEYQHESKVNAFMGDDDDVTF